MKDATAAAFAEMRAAAVQGYCDGGMRAVAARTIVASAAEDIAPLLAGPITPEFVRTFLVLLDANCGAFVRRKGVRACIVER
jgi:hypothetical protein